MLAVVLVLVALAVIGVTISGGHARYETLEYLIDSSGRKGR